MHLVNPTRSIVSVLSLFDLTVTDCAGPGFPF